MWIFILIIAIFIIYIIGKNNKGSKTSTNSKSGLSEGKFNVAVKGLLYRGTSSQVRAGKIKPGEKLFLKKEENNIHDKNAVAVYTSDNYHIGYVDAFFSYHVSTFIDENKIIKCVATRISPDRIPYIYMDIFFEKI